MTTSGQLAGNGLRIWDDETKTMTYLENRYVLAFPYDNVPCASVIDQKIRVKKKIFMLRVGKNRDRTNGNWGVYDQDIIEYTYRGTRETGVVYYDQEKAAWAIRSRTHYIPFFSAENIQVIGNTFENQK